MCVGPAEKSLEQPLEKTPVPDQGNTFQHVVDILNEICAAEDQKDKEIVDLLQTRQKSSEPIYSVIDTIWRYGIWNQSIEKRLLWMYWHLASDENCKKEKERIKESDDDDSLIGLRSCWFWWSLSRSMNKGVWISKYNNNKKNCFKLHGEMLTTSLGVRFQCSWICIPFSCYNPRTRGVDHRDLLSLVSCFSKSRWIENFCWIKWSRK